VQERLGRIAANAYLLDAARRFTCAGLALGHHPSVVSAIMKNSATERMRVSANDAMDVHAGKAVIDGPKNYLGTFYRSVPVGITVEGANILTRSLIVFGQGAIRAHPFILKEMEALADEDMQRGLAAFDVTVWAHAGHILRTAKNAFIRSWSDGLLGPAPETGPTKRYYRKLSRYAASFALASDAALLTMGGSLKRKEMLSARFGDILAELYLLSATLKRWEEDGRQEADLPLVEWIMQDGFLTIERRMKEILDNFPNQPVAWLLGLFVLPFGVIRRGPSDRVTRACARLILEPSATRDRLTDGVYLGVGDDAVAELERALDLVVSTEPIRDRLKKLRVRDPDAALDQGLISREDHDRLAEVAIAVAKVVAVDDFSPEEITGKAVPAEQMRVEAAE
jgi:acyl-CoA dehydrogenase